MTNRGFPLGRTLLAMMLCVAGCGGSEDSGAGDAGSGEAVDFKAAAKDVRSAMADKPPEGMTVEDQVELAVSAYIDEAGNALRYKKTAGGFELRSSGPDAQPGTPDDVVRQFTK